MQTFSFLFMFFYFCLVAVLSLYGFHRCWLLYLYFRYYKWVKPAATPPLPHQLPIVSIQLPIYNERYVVERLIDAVCSLDYPQDLLDIQILDDSTDDTCQIIEAKVALMREKGFLINHKTRKNRIGFKAGALAAGLKQAKGEFIGIFDADFVPQPDFLKKTLAWFKDPSIGMVQTRWGHLNEDYSLLTRIQAIFLDAHFLIEQTARNRSGSFFNFNGTAGIWRKEAIASSGGWQHDTLTEDLDLSYRAQLAGWKFMFLPDVVCPAELPVDINAFKSQQKRWATGTSQTAKKILPKIWRSTLPLKVKLEATFHLNGYAATLPSLIFSVILPISIYFRANQHWLWINIVEGFGLISSIASLSLFYAVCKRDLHSDWKMRMSILPCVISLGFTLCLSNSKAVLQGLLSSKQFEFCRTPKYSVIEKDSSWMKKSYKEKNMRAAFVESAFSAYYLAALIAACKSNLWVSSAIISIFGFGFSYLAFSTITHNRIGRYFGASKVITENLNSQ